MAKSCLDEISGVGPKKRDALIQAFGTSEEVSKLSIEELEILPEINHNLAVTIFNYFKSHPITYQPEE